tara:strand:- start:152444 stop:152986 length:543 start_codon:yes stop_codon:yes gene_type:complete
MKELNVYTGEYTINSEDHETIINEFVGLAKKATRKASAPFKLSADFWKRLIVTLDFNDHRTASRGGYRNGVAWINLALDKYPRKDGYRFKEYSTLATSQSMGSCQGSLRVYLFALCAHELAHAMQYYARSNPQKLADKKVNKAGISRLQLKPPHGDGFKEIYRFLRIELVNKIDGFEWLK